MRLVGAHARALELGHAQQAPVTCGECAFEAFPPLPRMLLGCARDIGGDVALGVAQAHQQEDRRPRRADVLQAAPVFLDIACSCQRARVAPAAGLWGPSSSRAQLAGVSLEVPAPAHPQDLNVRLDRLEGSEQREEASALAVLAEPRVGGDVDRESGPTVVEPVREHAVAVHERDRRPHPSTSPRPASERISSRAPGASAITVRALQHPSAGQSAAGSATDCVAPSASGSCSTDTSTAPGPV